MVVRTLPLVSGLSHRLTASTARSKCSIERPLDERLGGDTPSLGDVRLGVGAFTLTDRQQSGDDGDDKQDGESGKQPLEPAVDPTVPADLVVGVASTRVEEVAFGGSEVCPGLRLASRAPG